MTISEYKQHLDEINNKIRELEREKQEWIRDSKKVLANEAIDKIELESYEFSQDDKGYMIRANCGFDPNKPFERYSRMKCSSYWRSDDGVLWTKINN